MGYDDEWWILRRDNGNFLGRYILRPGVSDDQLAGLVARWSGPVILWNRTTNQVFY